MTRVWGGRTLAESFGRSLPDDQPYGESWELVDRPDEQSVVKGGPHAGKTLHELWTDHREELFGAGHEGDRFPILVKILDARDDLSIQVHPPLEKAAELGGEPKTEMWYIADCDPGSKLYIGLKDGVSREDFETSLQDGSVAEAVHAVEPQPQESIFIPSGRLHAIGAGFLIYEIQQNSDTTYRVFDWNRMGLDGNPRELHVEQSLASIDFEDFEPGMDEGKGGVLADCPFFRVQKSVLGRGSELAGPKDTFAIVAVDRGELKTKDGTVLGRGDFCLLPCGASFLEATQETTVLVTTLPREND